ALSTDFSTYNRGETPITSGTIQDVNGALWNTSVGDRFNYTLVNESNGVVQNTSVDFTVSNGSWSVNTRIPTFANASTSHKGFAYKINFTGFTNTTPLSNYNFCTYVNAYNVSRGLFCDAHAQNTTTLVKDSLILDNRSTEDDNEQKTYNTDDDIVYGWAHCVNARNESLASRIVSFTVLDTANNTAPGTSTDVRTTAADGWTTIGSPFNYSARSPTGTWFLWVNASDANGNEGGDNESLSFISTVSGIDIIGRVFFWINGTVVGSASIIVNIMDGARVIDTKTGTTDSNGGYSLSLGTTLVQNQVYTVNVTAIKGTLRSYVLQRFRA
ncbi:MAG: hypothetical protein HY366_00150, partial [Candidatus Aenigmarchaeota archaeon]|nr:hypothetical protein [Candidatus Aenigmarchaeota archaeon]